MSNKDKGGADEVTGFQLRETPIIESPVGSSPVAQPLAERETDELDRLGDLPHSYGSDTIFLIAQEPKWLFTYWDIDISRHPGGQAHLRVYRGDSELESEIEVPFETRNWYIPVKEAGSSYTVEIGYYRGQTWNTISRSVTVLTPPDKVSESESFDYASIPLHLSFQKLTDSIESAIRSGESLIEAISRLQREGHIASHVTPASFAELVGVQRALLESLLGAPLLEELTSGGLSSTEIDSRIRTYLEERLSSAGASEWFSSELLHSAGLSGLGLSSALSSGEVGSSWNIGALSSWASGALTSWVSAAGAGASWTSQSSWNVVASTSWAVESLGSWSQAAVSSWGAAAVTSWLHALQSSWFQAAQTSWFQAGQSSWSQAAQSSWLQKAETSWLQAAQASWSQAAQSSWGAGALSSWNQAALSSWTAAATSSWGGSSETLSSPGFGNREFFMHVNAEVIFYGGTDPRATVTIDGKRIALNPDGTFRYHFIFPDGKYEIPIVATSPDGVETRSAILRFERDTQKKGEVTDTAQPPLPSPIGPVF